MKYQKIFVWPLQDAYNYSLIYEDKKDPQDLTTEGWAYLFNYYNSQGKLEKRIDFVKGKESLVTQYQYEKDKLIEIKKDFIETGGTSRLCYIHGDKTIEKIEEIDGYVEKRTVQLFGDNSKLKEVQNYDNENQLISRKVFDEQGEVTLLEPSDAEKRIFKNIYDDKNHLIATQIFDEHDKLISEIRSQYLKDKIEEQSFWEDGHIIEKQKYYYSADDKLKRLTRFFPKENKEYESDYDSDENLIKTIIKMEGKQVFSWERTFFDDMMAMQYLSTLYKYTPMNQGALNESRITGKREVLLDDDKRIEAELLSNYTALGDEESFQNDSYFNYEYGEE